MDTNPKVFPSWRYHKEHGSKIIQTPEEHAEHEAEGWVESPAHVDKPKSKPPVEEKSKSENKEPELPPGQSESESELTDDSELEAKGEDELKEILMSMGTPKKQLKGLTKAELIALIEG